MSCAPYVDVECGREGGGFPEPAAHCRVCGTAWDLVVIGHEFICRGAHDWRERRSPVEFRSRAIRNGRPVTPINQEAR